ncbi:MAG: serine/threonine protein kinase [Gammaproteobacteria bacterium]|nr:MAG: serine/threonine protein kinase [Gammaproteobacteria bacterium]
MAQAEEQRIEAFGFRPGRVLKGKYEVVAALGAGWEGEVYLVRERATGIERTAKFFYPQRNPRDRAAVFYAKKLHRLRQCPIVIQYYAQEHMEFRGVPVTFLISEYVEGELLSRFLARQPGGRLSPFQAVHLLHALAKGIECIHAQGEYHGDLHADNIIVQRFGLGFEIKLLDMFHWGAPRAEHIHADVLDLVRIFYDALGGAAHYRRQPPEVKAICCGLKRSLILRKFRTAGQLRQYLETLTWQ